MIEIKAMLSRIIRDNGNYVSKDKAAESLREFTDLEAKLAIAEGEWKTYATSCETLGSKLAEAVELVESLRSLIELSMDSEYNYENWLEKNKEDLLKIKAK